MRLAKYLCKENIAKEHENTRGYHRISRCFTHLLRTTFDGIAHVSSHTRYDKGKEEALNNTHPHKPLVKLMLYTIG